MNLSLFIARRYFFSKKKKNFINVISIISMLVVGIATMALIIVLSVFNGLEDLLRGLYQDFDPEVQITATEGRSFIYDDQLKEKLKDIEGIEVLTEVVEDRVIIKYNASQRDVRLKGVSDNFVSNNRFDDSMVFGSKQLKKDDVPYALVGRGVQIDLQIKPTNDFFVIQVYYPRDIGPGVTDPTRLMNIRYIMPGGIFAIEKFYDENYMIVPIDFAVDLLNYGNKRNALEIQIAEGYEIQDVQRRVASALGSAFTVKTNDEIHDDIYKILKMEKLFVFVTLAAIIAVASINIYFALMMLAIDKRKDISILIAQGAPQDLIRRIFVSQGTIVAFTGAFTGLLLGLAISYGQQQFGFISMGMQSAIMEAYPVKVELWDVLFTCVAIIVVTFFASFQPARLAAKKFSLQDL
ncbi:MAG: FtsX-like permease family protein [Bacteroidota bacterium]